MGSFFKKNRWQSLPGKVASYDLIWLLVIIAGFRMLYYFCFLPTEYPDTASYVNFSANIFRGQADLLRTPVYPWFIALIKLFGQENLFLHIVIAQSLVSFLSIIVFYKTASLVFNNRLLVVLSSFVYGLLPSIVNFDYSILTESVSISAMVVFLYLAVSYLREPAVSKAIICTGYIFLLVMLRPAFICLLPLIIIFWMIRIVLYKEERIRCISGLVTCMVCIALISGYSKMNYNSNGCHQITAVSNVNQLTVLIDYNIYMDASDPQLSDTIHNMAVKDRTAGLNGRVFSHYGQLTTTFSHDRIEKYIISCLVHHPGTYFKSTIIKIVGLGKLKTSVIRARLSGNIGKGLASVISVLPDTYSWLFILLFLDGIYMVIRWVRGKPLTWYRLGLWAIIIAQISTAALGAPNGFPRLVVIAYPVIIIWVFGFFELPVIHRISRMHPSRVKDRRCY